MRMIVCQSCGKEIRRGEKAVEIRYGKLEKYARTPKERVFYNKNKVDFFHENCDKAFRNPTKR